MALEAAFAGWEDARPRPRDPDAVRALLERHRAPAAPASDAPPEVDDELCGALAQRERPDWEPLIALVGLDVVGCFMWMNELVLEDGTRLHAYKNIATRRYLHLAVDGRAFAERASDRYEEVTPLAALEEAFAGWEDLYPPPRDPEAVRALLARASQPRECSRDAQGERRCPRCAHRVNSYPRWAAITRRSCAVTDRRRAGARGLRERVNSMSAAGRRELDEARDGA